MAVLALGSLLCATSQDVFQLIRFVFVQGIGGAMVQSSGRTLGFRAMRQAPRESQGLMAMSPVRLFCRSAARGADHRLDSLARHFLLFLCRA